MRDKGWRGPHFRSVAIALLLDSVVGEPPYPRHPVAVFGQVMQYVEKKIYADRRDVGVLHTVIGVGVGVATGVLIRSTVIAASVAIAGLELVEVAADVASALLAGDVARARFLLPSLVGRDPRDLDEAQIVRAVVESVAENTVDAVVAPAFWAVVAGAPGALGYRAANTLDSMVGHHSSRYERFGFASARLDDALAWLPARLTALLIVALRPRRASDIWRAVRDQAPSHPSPNAGVAEAAFAAALGCQLGGCNRYDERVEVRPVLGYGRAPVPIDIRRAMALSRQVAWTFAAVLWLLSMRHGRLGRR